MCRKHCKNHSPRHILQKPLATRKTQPNKKIRQKGLEKQCQKNKKNASISEQILTQKSWIFVNFRPPGPPEVLKMLLRVPFRKTLQIWTASGTHFSGFSWIWAPKLEAKIVPPKKISSLFCSKMRPKIEFSTFSGFYWIFLQFSPKFPDFSLIFHHFLLTFWAQFCTQVAYTNATSALRTFRIKRAGGGSGSAGSIIGTLMNDCIVHT